MTPKPISTAVSSLHARGETITIELPLPARGLHRNARVHHMARSRMVNKARFDAGLVAKLAKPESCPWSAATIHATFYVRRKHDDDGLVDWLKSYRDGLQDAGIVLDDTSFRMGDVEQVIGKDVDRRVVLRIEQRMS